MPEPRNTSHRTSQSALELCFELVERENHQALQSNDVDFARAALNAGQRKLTSLQSLKTINQLIQECEW